MLRLLPLLFALVAALGCAPLQPTCEEVANLNERNECQSPPPPPNSAGYVPPAEAAQQCRAQSECPAGSVCTLAGTCSRTVQCAKDDDCAWDERCDARQCVKLPNNNPPGPLTP